MRTILTLELVLLVSVFTLIIGCHHDLSSVERPTGPDVSVPNPDAEIADIATTEQVLPKTDITHFDSSTDSNAPDLGALLVHGGIGTAASVTTSKVLLLDGAFETGKLLCLAKINACLIGGIEP